MGEIEDAAVARANAAQMKAHGTQVLYSSGGSTPVPISGIFEHEGDPEEIRARSAVQASGKLWVFVADVPDPQYQDKATVDEETWTVVRKLEKSGGMWLLECRRDLRATFKRE